MSRSFRNLFGSSVLVSVAAFALTACGSGSGGSADLGEGGGGGVVVEKTVTVSTTFDFAAPAGYFVVGNPPIHARFLGGVAANNGAWIVKDGATAVINFATPADTVKFTTQDNYSATAAVTGGAQKTGSGMGAQAVTNQFSVPMYLRGLKEDWVERPANKFKPDACLDNVLVLSVNLGPDIVEDTFKIADANWTDALNCGANDSTDIVPIGSPYPMVCRGGFSNAKLTIPEDAKWKFKFDARNESSPILTVTKDTGVPDDCGGGGGGGTVPNSTEIRIYGIDTLTAGAQEELLTTITDKGTISVAEVKDRNGGSPRITRIEIQNLGTAGDIGIEDFEWVANPRFAPSQVQTDIVYRRPLAGQTTGTRIAIGGVTYNCTPSPDTAFACIVRDVPVFPYANYYMAVTNTDGSSETIQFNAGQGGDIDDDPPGEIVFAMSGGPIARNGVPGEGGSFALPTSANEVMLFYHRDDNDYDGWALHLFPIDPAGDSWTKYAESYASEGVDPVWGAYYRIVLPGSTGENYSNDPAAITTFPAALGVVIHRDQSGTDVKDPNGDLVIRIGDMGNIVFVNAGNLNVGSVPPNSGAKFAGINGAIAHWVNAGTLVSATAKKALGVDEQIPGLTAQLLYSPDGSIRTGPTGIIGTFEAIPLTSTALPSAAELPNQKHLTVAGDYVAYSLPQDAVSRAKTLARGQLVMRVRFADGTDYFGTQVQIPGALDDLYAGAAFDKPLGVTYAGGAPSLSVWAPTALKDPGVSVNIYDAAGNKLETVPMTLDESSGIWSVTGNASWNRKFYTISLKVYSYAVNSIVTNEVTDPYSVSLAMDSVRSQFVNLNDADLKPAGWDAMALPPLAQPEDLTIYELHVRDFSIADTSVPAADRGKFTAFDIAGTVGRQHLQELAGAGLKAVHILPAFDIATVKENPADRVELDDPVDKLCAKNAAAAELCSAYGGMTIRQAMEASVGQNGPDRPSTQQIQAWLSGYDGYNWGYDPWHFGVPEGSYSTNPNGPQRILEFRRMVRGLDALGLRTIMDVVYNHTNASGQNSKSVLDRVVPGYYHRRDPLSGSVFRNSCCEDTAAEFRMMEKLMIDTGVMWVRDYKVAGFRFDLMSMHPLGVMEDFKAAVEAINPTVYIYGEGWNIDAQIKNDAWFTQARQANLGGTGIGSFSDRIRDPIRGGGPFDAGDNYIKNQGFISGQFYDPNALNSGATAERVALLNGADNIRVWEAGGLANFSHVDRTDAAKKGSEIKYTDQNSGYTLDPQEAINYISKHDNESLWDISQYKHPTGTPLADRVRADSVGMSLILLAQGVPFLQAGTEILRSKSMDRNSYDSGDWYNEIDWTLATSKWNMGLPPAQDNSGNYTQIRQVSADPTAAQDPAARQRAFDVFKEFLRIRYSSNLFRMPTEALIEKRMSFFNTGSSQVPGVIGMSYNGCTEPGASFVPDTGGIVVIANATDGARTLNLYGDDPNWVLHPVQASGVDPVVKTSMHNASGFTVPARTTAVFVRTAQASCAPYSKPIFLRGLGTDWTDAPANELVFKGGTLYEQVKPLAAGADPDGFKIASSDWSTVDCGSGIPVTFGAPLPLVCNAAGNTNINLNVPTAADYVFKLDAASTANPVLTVVQRPTYYPADIYVRGIAEDWSDAAKNRMAPAGLGGKVYRVALNAPAGPDNVGFKIASSDWSTVDCGSTTAVTIGQPLTLACNGPGNGNIDITFPSAGQYLFSLDTTSPLAPVLTVSKTPYAADIFIRGVGTDWSDSIYNRLQYEGGGIYRGYKTASAGADPDGFKIASSDWATADCGASAGLTVGQPLPMICNAAGNGNVGVTWPATGMYTFTLDATNAATPTLTVTGP